MPDQGELDRARDVVRPMARRLDLEKRNSVFAANAWRGGDSGRPTLHLEDVSEIPFVSVVPGVEEYQHRARVRAGEGDLFVAVTAMQDGYEAYCRDHLGLASPRFVPATPGAHQYAVAAACSEGDAFEAIVEVAARSGGLTIHPYMSIEPVWRLAARVAERARVGVEVIGSPPPVLWLANDKALFTELVRRVLSPDSLVETHSSKDPSDMAHHLARLAERHGRVGLKRTRCASAMGNAVYDLRRIESMDPDRIEAEVRSFLERTEWALDEEVLIVAWEETDHSPSTQLWIPPDGTGDPVVEGVYEQLLEGDEKIFLGSRPSRLPRDVNSTLAEASLQVGAALQSLGYVGRCSFDFILVPNDAGHVRPKFVECNGRWGGTSTPMRLVDRLTRGRRPFYRAQDYMHHDLIGMQFGEILRRVGDALYDPRTGEGRYVFYNVGPLARHGKLDVIAFGADPDDVDRAVAEDLPRRLGLGSRAED